MMDVDDFYRIAWRVWRTYSQIRPWWKKVDQDDAVQVAVLQCWKYRDKQVDARPGFVADRYYRMVARHAIQQYANRKKNRPLDALRFRVENHHPVTETDEVVNTAALREECPHPLTDADELLNRASLEEEVAMLRQKLNTLNPTTKTVLLRVAQGDLMREVAKDLGCTKQAVSSRRNLALKSLTEWARGARIQP